MIIPAITPRRRMAAMISSSSGCSSGSPPESVTMLVPRSANLLMRLIMTSDGDGLREVVVFVAVGARQVAAADGDDVRHDGMACK